MIPTCLHQAVAAVVFALCTANAFAQASAPAAGSSPAAPAAVAAATPSETGKIAWYGKKFAGRKTASGEAFNPEALTMAHKTLPFGTLVKVTNPKNQKSVTRVKITNPKNNKSVIVRVNDRGPTQADRVGDVSYAAARKLGMLKSGVIEAELAVVGTAPAKKR
jgi:rare lipoprotein A